MKNIYILIIIIAQTCCLFADDNSTRRYAALDHDMVTCKCFLLSTKQVQDSLKLTQQQIKSLEGGLFFQRSV
jgi:hypothetical protein